MLFGESNITWDDLEKVTDGYFDGFAKEDCQIKAAADLVEVAEKHSGGYVSDGGWDMQKIDMGIALCHFELVAKEEGLGVTFEVADPGIEISGDMEYIASYRIG